MIEGGIFFGGDKFYRTVEKYRVRIAKKGETDLKKFFAVFLAAAFALALTACGGPEGEQPAVSQDVTEALVTTAATDEIAPEAVTTVSEATAAATTTDTEASTEAVTTTTAEETKAAATTTAKKTEAATTATKKTEASKTEAKKTEAATTTADATKAPATTTTASEEIPVFSGGDDEEEESAEGVWEDVENLDEWLLEMGIDDASLANAG